MNTKRIARWVASLGPFGLCWAGSEFVAWGQQGGLGVWQSAGLCFLGGLFWREAINEARAQAFAEAAQ